MSGARLACAGLAIAAVVGAGRAAFDRSEVTRANAWTDAAAAAGARVIPKPAPSAPRVTTCAEARDRTIATIARVELAADESLDATTLGGDLAQLGCLADVEPILRTTPSCGAGYAAIVSGIASNDRAPAAAIEAIASGAPAACETAILRALSTGAIVSRGLVAIAERALGADDQARKTSAWLALGTLGHLARDADAELALRVDRRLEAALAADDDRVLRLEAAGNAGCTTCVKQIDRATRDAAWDVRRAAVAAWRFQSQAGAAAAMCRPLVFDPSTAVRESAAWAMQWRHEDDAERVECLVTAAATDASEAVRRAATRSLIALAAHSTAAHGAVVHLTGEAYAPEVRQMATDFAMTTDVPVALFNSTNGRLPWRE